jgi:hypothetical protein
VRDHPAQQARALPEVPRLTIHYKRAGTQGNRCR